LKTEFVYTQVDFIQDKEKPLKNWYSHEFGYPLNGALSPEQITPSLMARSVPSVTATLKTFGDFGGMAGVEYQVGPHSIGPATDNSMDLTALSRIAVSRSSAGGM
jgi:hypothetical protein